MGTRRSAKPPRAGSIPALIFSFDRLDAAERDRKRILSDRFGVRVILYDQFGELSRRGPALVC